MSNKFPTAHEMRLRAIELRTAPIPLEELPLCKEAMKRLQESTGHCGVTRDVCVYTDQYVDVCIEPGTGSTEIDRVSTALRECGFYVSWVTGKNSSFAGRDTLRICWDARSIASAAGLSLVDGKPQDPCKKCDGECWGRRLCYKKHMFDSLIQDWEGEKC